MNNWNDENIKTVTKWKRNTRLYANKYQETLNKYFFWYNLLMISTLVINGIVTLDTVIASALSSLAGTSSNVIYTWTSMGVSVVGGVLSAAAFTITSIIAYSNLSEKTKNLSTVIEKLHNFESMISTQLSLSDELRTDADTFIRKYKEEYYDAINVTDDGITGEDIYIDNLDNEVIEVAI
jgi:hypothetical protein